MEISALKQSFSESILFYFKYKDIKNDLQESELLQKRILTVYAAGRKVAEVQMHHGKWTADSFGRYDDSYIVCAIE